MNIEGNKLPILIEEEIQNVNKPVAGKEVEFVIC